MPKKTLLSGGDTAWNSGGRGIGGGRLISDGGQEGMVE